MGLFQVLHEQGLGKYCDADFVRATQRELAEAFNLTQEEMDRAAHEIMQAEHRRSLPYLLSSTSDPTQGVTQDAETTANAEEPAAPNRPAENGKTSFRDTTL